MIEYAKEKDSIPSDSYDWMWKIVILGDSGVGKSSIISRHVKDEFSPNHESTTGVDYQEKTMNLLGKCVKTQIWDTAGQERFRSLIKTFFRKARAVLLVYDVTDRRSFDHCENWLGDLTEYVESGLIVILVGNKIDLVESTSRVKKDREVSVEDAIAFATRNHLFFIETSAKSGRNVSDAFVTVVQDLIRIHTGGSNVDFASRHDGIRESENKKLDNENKSTSSRSTVKIYSDTVENIQTEDQSQQCDGCW